MMWLNFAGIKLCTDPEIHVFELFLNDMHYVNCFLHHILKLSWDRHMRTLPKKIKFRLYTENIIQYFNNI